MKIYLLDKIKMIKKKIVQFDKWQLAGINGGFWSYRYYESHGFANNRPGF